MEQSELGCERIVLNCHSDHGSDRVYLTRPTRAETLYAF